MSPSTEEWFGAARCRLLSYSFTALSGCVVTMLRLYLISSWIHHEFTDAAALPIHPALDRSAVLGRDHLPIVQRRRFEERLHAQTNRDGAHLLLQRRESHLRHH